MVIDTCPVAPDISGAAGVRHYALEVVTDKSGQLHVIDFNGARSDCAIQQKLYGDDRVAQEILQHLAYGADGLIELNHVDYSLLESKVSAETLRALHPDRWYRGAHLFQPSGLSFSRRRAGHTKSLADRLHIPYSVVNMSTHSSPSRPGGLTLSDDQSGIPSGWRIWPYSWDQRLRPLGDSTVNPDAQFILSTNKLIAARALGSYSPLTRLVCCRHSLLNVMPSNSPYRWVIKPLRGRRGFGVLPLLGRESNDLVSRLGFTPLKSSQTDMKILALALAFGGFVDLFAIAQRFVHPPEKLEQPFSYRAVILARGESYTCLDVCKQKSIRGHDPRSRHIAVGNVVPEKICSAEFGEVSSFCLRAVAQAELWIKQQVRHSRVSAAHWESQFMTTEVSKVSGFGASSSELLSKLVSHLRATADAIARGSAYKVAE